MKWSKEIYAELHQRHALSPNEWVELRRDDPLFADNLKLSVRGLKKCKECKDVFITAVGFKMKSTEWDGFDSRCNECRGKQTIKNSMLNIVTKEDQVEKMQSKQRILIVERDTLWIQVEDLAKEMANKNPDTLEFEEQLKLAKELDIQYTDIRDQLELLKKDITTHSAELVNLRITHDKLCKITRHMNIFRQHTTEEVKIYLEMNTHTNTGTQPLAQRMKSLDETIQKLASVEQTKAARSEQKQLQLEQLREETENKLYDIQRKIKDVDIALLFSKKETSAITEKFNHLVQELKHLPQWCELLTNTIRRLQTDSYNNQSKEGREAVLPLDVVSWYRDANGQLHVGSLHNNIKQDKKEKTWKKSAETKNFGTLTNLASLQTAYQLLCAALTEQQNLIEKVSHKMIHSPADEKESSILLLGCMCCGRTLPTTAYNKPNSEEGYTGHTRCALCKGLNNSGYKKAHVRQIFYVVSQVSSKLPLKIEYANNTNPTSKEYNPVAAVGGPAISIGTAEAKECIVILESHLAEHLLVIERITKNVAKENTKITELLINKE